jgi:hypothetical protein
MTMARLVSLTDRVKLEIPLTGDLTTAQYARFAMDAAIDVLNDEVFEVHEIILQPRYPSTTEGPYNHTGAFVPLWGELDGVTGTPSVNFSDVSRYANLRLLTTTIAYQNIRELGIATPGVLTVDDHWTFSHTSSIRYLAGQDPETAAGMAYGVDCEWGHYRYTMLDTQPIIVGSDILIGVSADNWADLNGEGKGQVLDLEVDVIVLGKARKGTKADLAELKEQNNVA